MKALRLAAMLAAMSSGAKAACTVSATGVMFGTYDGYAASPVDVTGTIRLTCDANSGANPIQIALNVGSVVAGGASYAERFMASSNVYLGYNLYTDPARATVWGDGSAGTQTVTAPASLAANGGTSTFTVYGRVRAGQRRYTPTGAYSTSVTATATY